MCIRVQDLKTHISVHVHLMRGEFDNYLKWPFRGSVAIQLLNQLEDKEHYERTIAFTDETCSGVDISGRVTWGSRSAWGLGMSQFIARLQLQYDAANNCQYLKNDCLCFRVTKVKIQP